MSIEYDKEEAERNGRRGAPPVFVLDISEGRRADSEEQKKKTQKKPEEKKNLKSTKQ